MLPGWCDAISDRFWGLTPRSRTTLLAVLTVALLSGAALRAAAAPYGEPVPVLVATEDLPVGAALDADTLRTVRWPGDLAPSSARRDASGTLAAPLPAGAILTDGHVTDDGLSGLVGAGRSAVPIPAELVPALPTGTAVQVVATGVDGTGAVLAEHAEVVSVEAAIMWLAVPQDAAADVAAAGLRGTVTLAVHGTR